MPGTQYVVKRIGPAAVPTRSGKGTLSCALDIPVPAFGRLPALSDTVTLSVLVHRAQSHAVLKRHRNLSALNSLDRIQPVIIQGTAHLTSL